MFSFGTPEFGTDGWEFTVTDGFGFCFVEGFVGESARC